VNELTDEFIDQLIQEEKRPKPDHIPTPIKSRPRAAMIFDPEQKGPITYHDKEMRCASRGCSSPTYVKIRGVPRCSAHALREANDMLTEAGFRGA